MKPRTLTAALAGFLAGVTLVAASAAAGDANDPVISLSYLQNVFAPEMRASAEEAAQNKAREVFNAERDALAAEIRQSLSGSGSTASAEYQTVRISKGQMICPDGGSIEVLLRRGSYVCVDPVGEKIPNLTRGGEAGDGAELTLQNLYIVPKDDGRGIKAVAEADGWVMVRGAYKLVTP